MSTYLFFGKNRRVQCWQDNPRGLRHEQIARGNSGERAAFCVKSTWLNMRLMAERFFILV